MPLKDVEKLTVVKLRAELTARGLDAKGNKPFLVERLRAALEREEQAGVTHLTEAKVCSSEEQVGELITEQESADMSVISTLVILLTVLSSSWQLMAQLLQVS